MTFRAGIAALFVLGLCGTPAMSANPKCDPGPSQADIDACTPDVHEKCGEFIPNRDAITNCLVQKNRQNLLSAACHKVMSRPFNRHLPPCNQRAGNN